MTVASLVGHEYCDSCGRRITEIHKDYSRNLGGQTMATWVCYTCAQLSDDDFWAVYRTFNEQGADAAQKRAEELLDKRFGRDTIRLER